MSTAVRPRRWDGSFGTVVPPALVAFATLGAVSFAAGRQPDARPLDALAVVLLVAGPAALLLRRIRPRGVLLVVSAALVVYLGLGYPMAPPVPLTGVIALFGAAATGYHVAAITAAVLGPSVLATWAWLDGRPFSWTSALVLFAWLSLVIAAGVLWRFRRERREQARAAQAEEQRRKAGEERLRIAQELHDVLGHHVSLINVQAGVALFLLDDDPEQARTALAEIKRSSRELLREMRSTLGVLRGVDAEAPHQPTPGLDRLDALLDDVRAAGLPVELRVLGEPAPLPTGVDLAAYRIVQESLTNTRRHAGASTATVLLRYAGEELELRIDDDGTGPASGEPAAGNGLVGMRERAHALGGRLEAGPGPERGFRVHARLPLPERDGVAPGPDAGTVPR